MNENELNAPATLNEQTWMDYPVSVRDILWAFENVPIMARLEFAKNLVCGNNGDKHSIPVNPALVVAAELMESVIEALRKNPKAANLKTDYEPR